VAYPAYCKMRPIGLAGEQGGEAAAFSPGPRGCKRGLAGPSASKRQLLLYVRQQDLALRCKLIMQRWIHHGEQ
jgi:hypothetical protein